VFGGDAYVFDADGARQEEQFGPDRLADECASRSLGDLIFFGRRKSNDDKPGAVNNATTCKLGRMTLPACGLAHANWTIATFGGQAGRLPNVAKHKLGQPWPKTARRRIYI
jgi:hypothetical protein